ncbi:MAG: hypothetical protein EBX45_03740, partial [Burkholderiaceae bacterium]|nr:hypothetical protein [Burkholderiaceae bacterium]
GSEEREIPQSVHSALSGNRSKGKIERSIFMFSKLFSQLLCKTAFLQEFMNYYGAKTLSFKHHLPLNRKS